MNDFLQLVATFREQTRATLWRSDILRALIWPVGILMMATVSLVVADAPSWLLITFAALFVLTIVLYGASYVFCLFTDRDALRSEKYALDKIAIEHGIYGDSQTGLIEPDPADLPTSARGLIEATTQPEPE